MTAARSTSSRKVQGPTPKNKETRGPSVSVHVPASADAPGLSFPQKPDAPRARTTLQRYCATLKEQDAANPWACRLTFGGKTILSLTNAIIEEIMAARAGRPDATDPVFAQAVRFYAARLARATANPEDENAPILGPHFRDMYLQVLKLAGKEANAITEAALKLPPLPGPPPSDLDRWIAGLHKSGSSELAVSGPDLCNAIARHLIAAMPEGEDEKQFEENARVFSLLIVAQTSAVQSPASFPAPAVIGMYDRVKRITGQPASAIERAGREGFGTVRHPAPQGEAKPSLENIGELVQATLNGLACEAGIRHRGKLHDATRGGPMPPEEFSAALTMLRDRPDRVGYQRMGRVFAALRARPDYAALVFEHVATVLGEFARRSAQDCLAGSTLASAAFVLSLPEEVLRGVVLTPDCVDLMWEEAQALLGHLSKLAKPVVNAAASRAGDPEANIREALAMLCVDTVDNPQGRALALRFDRAIAILFCNAERLRHPGAAQAMSDPANVGKPIAQILDEALGVVDWTKVPMPGDPLVAPAQPQAPIPHPPTDEKRPAQSPRPARDPLLPTPAQTGARAAAASANTGSRGWAPPAHHHPGAKHRSNERRDDERLRIWSVNAQLISPAARWTPALKAQVLQSLEKPPVTGGALVPQMGLDGLPEPSRKKAI